MEYVCVCVYVCMYTMKYYSKIKSKILPFEAISVNLEGIMLSEISQTKINTVYHLHAVDFHLRERQRYDSGATALLTNGDDRGPCKPPSQSKSTCVDMRPLFSVTSRIRNRKVGFIPDETSFSGEGGLPGEGELPGEKVGSLFIHSLRN